MFYCKEKLYNPVVNVLFDGFTTGTGPRMKNWKVPTKRYADDIVNIIWQFYNLCNQRDHESLTTVLKFGVLAFQTHGNIFITSHNFWNWNEEANADTAVLESKVKCCKL